MVKTCKSMNDVQASPIDWLWYPYIPFGKVVILRGDPGQGKSTFIRQLCAILTRAGKLPDGTYVNWPINIIYMCSEDGLSDTIKPCFDRAGADCNRIFYFEDDDDPLTLDDTESIEVEIIKHDVRLMVIDPLQHYIGSGTSMNSATSMRRALNKLGKIAEKYSCAMLIVCHNSKGAKKGSFMGILGSVDIPAFVRSVLSIEKGEYDPDLRYIKHEKSNVGVKGAPITFRIGEAGFEWVDSCDAKDIDPNGAIDVECCVMEDVDHGVVKDLALSVHKDMVVLDRKSEKLTKRQQVAEELYELLSKADIPSEVVFDIFAQKGISKRTVNTAKKEINATSIKIDDIWYMHLNKKQLSA